MKLNKSQSDSYADSLLELANISVGTLIFGSLFTEKFLWWLIPFGVILYILLVYLALQLRKE